MTKIEIAIWNFLVLHCSVRERGRAHYEQIASWLDSQREVDIWDAVTALCNKKMLSITEDGFCPIIDGSPMEYPRGMNKGLPRSLFLEGSQVVH